MEIPEKKPTAGIILAAGMSKRFGKPKQLLQLGGRFMVEWVLDAALNSRLEKIFLVLGHRYEDILREVGAKTEHPKIRVVVNHEYREGLSASLRAGVLEIGSAYPSAMFLLGDQPLVDSKTIDHLLERFRMSDKTIGVPVFGNRRGNPAIFANRYYPRLLDIKGDIGARRIIQDHPAEVLEVPVENPRCFFDVDTAEDFQKLSRSVTP